MKTIAVIGASDEETAHLRLLIRRSADELDCPWRFGDENGADLVVVDLRAFSGQMARTRALGAGIRCAVLSDEPVAGADLVVQRPLVRANIIAVLNEVARGVERPSIGAHTDDFYTRELGEEAADAPRGPSTPVPGLDEMLRPEPVELRPGATPAQAPAAAPPAAQPVAGTAPDTSRGAAPSPRRQYASRASMLADTAPHRLREYLAGGLLSAPARHVLPDCPPLVLDPKNAMAYSPSGLQALAPWCRAQWPLRDWQPLTGAELAGLRASWNAHPYERLVWLDALLHAGGRLPGHLDPGGTYKLRHWIEIEKDLSRYFRIASAMLQPVRLHEAAAAADAPMEDVFDFVAACDAIGLLEWQPRQRPEREPPPRAPLLQRLRDRFRS